MKILMFGWELPPHNSGGLGVACLGLANALVERGEEIAFVLPKRLGNYKVPFKIFFAGLPEAGLAYGRTAFAEGLMGEVEQYARFAKKIALENRFDVVHAHDWLTFSAGIAASRASGRPLVAHVHATEVDRTGGLGSVSGEVFQKEKEGFEAASKIIAVSLRTKSILTGFYGINPSKVEVVHNGIDVPPGPAETDEGLEALKKSGYKIVLSVGRITLQKGIDYLVSAAAEVLRARPKVIFVIVGSGDMEGQIMSQVGRLGLSGNFLFPGFLRGRDISGIFGSADLFVMPSVSEPFGLVALEALAHGKPVIVSKQSGLPR